LADDVGDGLGDDVGDGLRDGDGVFGAELGATLRDAVGDGAEPCDVDVDAPPGADGSCGAASSDGVDTEPSADCGVAAVGWSRLGLARSRDVRSSPDLDRSRLDDGAFTSDDSAARGA
jgi:hypothetical protein